jgi:hypothetical protein
VVAVLVQAVIHREAQDLIHTYQAQLLLQRLQVQVVVLVRQVFQQQPEEVVDLVVVAVVETLEAQEIRQRHLLYKVAMGAVLYLGLVIHLVEGVAEAVVMVALPELQAEVVMVALLPHLASQA